jgi:Sap-like sulfolipid-1-addressing protein
MGDVFVFALTAALNPTLLTATTVMLLLPRPKRLLLGYLLGALLTSITLGLVIIYTLLDSGAVSTQKHTVSPSIDLAIGAILLVLAFVLATGRHERLADRRRAKKATKEPSGPPRWQQFLGRGSARSAFVIGALLTLPGGSYIVGLTRIHDLDYSVAATVALVIVFNLIMLILLEAPLVSYAVAPEWTPNAIDRAKAWVGRHWRRFAVAFLTVMGLALVASGLVGLIG